MKYKKISSKIYVFHVWYHTVWNYVRNENYAWNFEPGMSRVRLLEINIRKSRKIKVRLSGNTGSRMGQEWIWSSKLLLFNIDFNTTNNREVPHMQVSLQNNLPWIHLHRPLRCCLFIQKGTRFYIQSTPEIIHENFVWRFRCNGGKQRYFQANIF